MKTQRLQPNTAFGEEYYSKWYDDDEARSDIADKALRFVLSYVDHMDAEIRNVLDLGCGLGLWKRALRRQSAGITYTGVEFSSYLCKRLGWEKGDVRTYSPGRKFDLVICQGVLQYVSTGDCVAAIQNLSRLCRRFLYLEVLTAGDVREVCAHDGTDFEVHVRDADWYAEQLRKHFVNLGGGLYAKPAMRRYYYELWRTG